MRKIFANNKVFAVIATLSVMLPLLAGTIDEQPRTLDSFFPDKQRKVSDSERRKAEYLFLEAERCIAEDEVARGFEILRYARKIDPANTAIANRLGMCVATMKKGVTVEEVGLAERLIREYYENDVDNYIDACNYAYIAQIVLPPDSMVAVWEEINNRFPNNEYVLQPLSEIYFKLGKFDKAIGIYESIEALVGKNIETTADKAVAYMALNDTTKCLEECNSLLATAPQNVTYNLFMCDIYAYYHKADSVDAYFDRAERLEPENGRIYLKRAKYYKNEGDTVNYDKQMYKALTNRELSVDEKREALLEYSAELVHSRDSSDRAVNLFRVLVDEHPHEYSIRELFADYLWTMGDYSGAAEQLTYGLDMEPKKPDRWRMLAYCYTNEYHFAMAEDACMIGLKYNENDIEIMRLLGIIYLQEYKFDEAQEQLDKTIALVDPTDADILSSLYELKGDAYYQSGDTAKVLPMYEKALEYYPDKVSTLNNYAYNLCCMGGDLNKAEQMSYRTILAEPNNPTYLDTYAWILFTKANYKEALLYMEKAIEAQKSNDEEQGNNIEQDATILEHYGDILFMNGRPDDALEQWEKAIEINPDNEVLQRKVEHKTYFFK